MLLVNVFGGCLLIVLVCFDCRWIFDYGCGCLGLLLWFGFCWLVWWVVVNRLSIGSIVVVCVGFGFGGLVFALICCVLLFYVCWFAFVV